MLRKVIHLIEDEKKTFCGSRGKYWAATATTKNWLEVTCKRCIALRNTK